MGQIKMTKKPFVSKEGGRPRDAKILYRYCLCLMAPQLCQSHECQVTTMEQVTFYYDWENINMRVYKMSLGEYDSCESGPFQIVNTFINQASYNAFIA